jgi:Uma2 family endonuclease
MTNPSPLTTLASPLDAAELQRAWQRVVDDDSLESFEGRTELDADGELVMTPPPSFAHQRVGNALARQLEQQLGGRAVVECPIVVDGVLVADVAWFEHDRADRIDTSAAVAPDLVIEVASPRNSDPGLRRKARRCLEHGAREVLVVRLDGTVWFLTAAGESDRSALGFVPQVG